MPAVAAARFFPDDLEADAAGPADFGDIPVKVGAKDVNVFNVCAAYLKVHMVIKGLPRPTYQRQDYARYGRQSWSDQCPTQ